MTNTELSNEIISDWEGIIKVKISKCNLDLLNDFIIEGIHKARKLQHEVTKKEVLSVYYDKTHLTSKIINDIEMPNLD